MLSHIFVQTYLTCYQCVVRLILLTNMQFGGVFCRLGNLAWCDAPLHTHLITGMLINMYSWDRICTFTANHRLHISDNCSKMQEAKLEFINKYKGVGVWVLQEISILYKTSNFQLIYPEILMISVQRLDLLHTTCTIFEVQSIHLQDALLGG